MKINKKGKVWLVAAVGFMGMAAMPFLPQGSATNRGIASIDDSTTVWEIYEKLGKIKLHKMQPAIQGASAAKGQELVTKGYTTDAQGKKTPVWNRMLTCSSCHLSGRESEDWSKLDPESRLAYSMSNKTPFLPGTSFYGLVNRVAFFNEEYQKKYATSPDIGAARTDIRRAIQLCATQVTPGRALQDWETESIVQYFWSLQLKIGDLHLSEEEKNKIELSFNDGTSSARAIHILEDHFPDKLPAHFTEPPAYKKWQESRLLDKSRFLRGEAIYEYSCRSCHADKRKIPIVLDKHLATFKMLMKDLEEGESHAFYTMIRKGTTTTKGKKAYMPSYTTERMSDVQLEDLRLYIEAMARGLDSKIREL